MSFLKNIIRNAVSEGIGKGIRDAVSSAVEKAVAPKAEAYANSVADSLDDAAKAVESNAAQSEAQERKSSSLEDALNRLAQSAEKYAATLEQAAVEQEDLSKMWNEKVPGFPMWCFGGTEFRFEETGKDAFGSPYYYFCVENATQEGLDAYVALLKREGFVRKYPTADEVLYKDLGGEYLVFGKTDAFDTAPTMMVGMYRTKDKTEIQI